MHVCKCTGQVFTCTRLFIHDAYAQDYSGITAYHANQQPAQNRSPVITAMLPLFPDDSKSVAMIRQLYGNYGQRGCAGTQPY